MDQKIPNTFIVGAPKCGTTALAQYLTSHASVYFSDPKELFYWSFDFPGQAAIHGMSSLERYLARFAKAEPKKHSVIAEGSTHYLVSECAIKSILQFNPQAKIIAMIRNPMEVVHAYHGELLFNFQEDIDDFRQAWQLRQARKEQQFMPLACPSPHNLQYDRFALYAPQLRRLFKVCPEENRLVIVFDDFKRSTAAVYRSVLSFLGLEDDGRVEFEKVYGSRKHRFPILMRMLKSGPAPVRPLAQALRQSYKTVVPSAIRQSVRRYTQESQPRLPLDDDFLTELRDFFRTDIIETSRLLNRDLTHWALGN